MNKKRVLICCKKIFFPNSMENLVMWIFSLSFTGEKTPQNNFSRQNFSVENNYFSIIEIFNQVFLGFLFRKAPIFNFLWIFGLKWRSFVFIQVTMLLKRYTSSKHWCVNSKRKHYINNFLLFWVTAEFQKLERKS